MKKLVHYMYSDLSGWILNVSDLYDEEPSECGLFAMLSELGMAKPIVLARFCLEISYGVRSKGARCAHVWQGSCQGVIAIPVVDEDGLWSG